MFVNRKYARFFVLLLILLSITIGLAACGGDNVPPATNEGPTAVSPSTATAPAEVATLPPPVVAMSTHTPLPATETSTATATSISTPVPPTGTAVPPTNTPLPQAPPPTAVPPTEPPPPPPTEPPPPPIGANGLVASRFALQDRSDFSVNGRVWFEFTIDNTTSGEVSYNALGVMPRKDGVDRFEWYQQTYGGRDSTIDAGGFSWEDNIRLPEPGEYTLRLVMCFDGFDACLQNRGQWFSLSQEIAITIN